MGPTEDDLTVAVMAQVAGVPVVRDERWESALKAKLEKTGLAIRPHLFKQADIPQGAEVINNPKGHARGFAMQIGECRFFCLPGVPYELHAMMNETVFPYLQANYSLGAAYGMARLRTFGLAESVVSGIIADVPIPECVDRGVLIRLPFIETKMRYQLDNQIQALEHFNAVSEALGDCVVGENQSLVDTVGQLLAPQAWTIEVHEHATQGEIYAMLKQSESLAERVDKVVIEPRGVDKLSQQAEREAFVELLATTTSARRIVVASSWLAQSPCQVRLDLAIGDEVRHLCITALFNYRSQGFSQLVATVALDSARRLILGLPTPGDYQSADYRVEVLEN